MEMHLPPTIRDDTRQLQSSALRKLAEAERRLTQIRDKQHADWLTDAERYWGEVREGCSNLIATLAPFLEEEE